HADAVAPAANPGWGASDWSQPAAAPAAGPAEDVWAKLAIGAEVDWSRGFAPPAQPAPPPAAAPAPVSEPASAAAEAWGPAPATPAPLAAAPALAPGPAAPTASSDVAWAAFLAAAGVAPGDLKTDPAQAAASAGEIVRRLVGGLVVMLEARARAKAQLGAQSTSLEFDGNNPLKFARSPERVVAQLLNPPERGFMSADKAVADSFQDLQAHQMATLAAMQSALKSTLARFSPESIRERAEMRGLLAKILPGARDAAMWQAYEKEFEGVAQGSDEAFMDVFSKAFKQAYEEAAVSMKGKT
ncbi:MAG TPA: type VI secretion system-associated FHA domain protein TagH, partial [Caulobacteraceae bacterium]|nr:type VI secretion system-associated FHA domain protein TagH [Caulobacteraceae bacterium]